jgi:anti-sigma regulatory factor (Ser/Thr protein kinase)
MPKVLIPAKFEYFEQIRELVDRTAKEAGLNDSEIYKVQLAVDEACSNIVEHGYGEEGIGNIECMCLNRGDGIEIVIRDWGSGFDPNGVPEPKLTQDVEEIKPRGAGIFLIKKLMDKVDFEFSRDKGNTLTIFKRKS